MAKVKFTKQVRYKSVKYPAHTVFQVEDTDVDALKAEGAIVIVPARVIVNKDTRQVIKPETVSLDTMKVAELIEYAKENNIPLGIAQRKDDIIAIISEALKQDEQEEAEEEQSEEN